MAEPPRSIEVVVRACPTLEQGLLEQGLLISNLEARAPGVTGLESGEPGAESVEWLAEVCVAGADLTSTLTNTATGASDARRVPIPADLGPEGVTRLAATILAAQFRAASDLREAHEADHPPRVEPDDGASSVSPGADDHAGPMPLELVLGVSFQSVGGMNGETGPPSIAVGPGLCFGVLLDDVGIVEVRAQSLAFLGPSDIPASVSAVPLEVGGGYRFDLGPVSVAALGAVVAQRWVPSGQASAAGWRVGMGLAGRFAWPIIPLLELRLDAGVEYFPEAYVFGYEAGEQPVIVASLANWCWRGALGLAFRIQLF